jgi:hypothetical protein
VRNDYPLLSCLELGANQISVPIAEADDAERAQRLQALREEGVRVTARAIWATGADLRLPAAAAPVDAVELVLLDRVTVGAEEVRTVQRVAQSWPVRLSTMVRSHHAAAELPRWRYGFAAEDLPGIAQLLDVSLPVRIVLHAPDAATVQRAMSQAAGSNIPATAVDLIAPAGKDPLTAARELADLFLTACEAGVGGFLVDGLIELDRTLDLSAGLLDRACNPQPAFHALRILNSLVHAGGPATITRDPAGFRVDRDRLTATIATSGSSPLPDTVDPAADVIDLATGSTVTAPDHPAGPWMILHTNDRSTR